MKKLVAYVIAIAGLVVLTIGLGTFRIENEMINSFGSTTITIAGVVMVAIGVLMLRFGGLDNSSKKPKQSSEEVPIYEGEGKKRRIVGYRRS